jgi:maltooligosyltrehalose trehalohydrolase
MMFGARRIPVGAEVNANGVHFRVWAPAHTNAEVISDGITQPLSAEGNGYFSGNVAGLEAGALYKYRISGEEYPDPASRFQPDGPHGASQVVDPALFEWTDSDWQGTRIETAVIYEMHTGTFTQEGTWKSAAMQLSHLRELGVSVIELMPIAEFQGRFGWGYDGVDLFAPTRLYGTPEDLRGFVNAAHSEGIAVILDVVYNHLGASGNYIGKFSADYFNPEQTTDWGAAINFDGKNSGPVREFFIANAGYWVDEFHLDGLRLDATQNIYDNSDPHVLREITSKVREKSKGRQTIVVAENEPQETRLVRGPAKRGFGMDALWNDDLHHSAHVALTGHNDAYYTDYEGTAQEFVSAMKYGYLYQGQWYKWQGKRRGTPAFDLPASAFVTFIENHDQVANSARGYRIHRETTPGLLKAMTALILLGPGTPMLFQGQEFASSAPFYYFADVPDDLAVLVRKGRKEFMTQWRNVGMPAVLECLEDPCSPATFVKCKLDFADRDRNREILDLHTNLIRLRREDTVLGAWERGRYDGAVLSSHAFLLRAFDEATGDRLMVVNLGKDLHLNPAPEPLLAPPAGRRWEIFFSTEDPCYGGCGTAPLDTEENWRIPGQSTVVLRGIPGGEKLK